MLTQILKDDFEHGNYMPKYEEMERERMMPRVESETSDLGDSNENSFPNTPRGSNMDLRLNIDLGQSLLRSTETNI